ncbi:hypothetical protein N8843_00950 [Verrucomicrobia bacterium]|jgi:hypothetical protein|nr:hypothetical protein [Verrucomicrobiota bacterium]MDA7622537.1 hypothetical protein [Verrucomicrobiota bacterium]MDA7627180.1 hypothetical protein [Verrucomicrobiota bacterium]
MLIEENYNKPEKTGIMTWIPSSTFWIGFARIVGCYTTPDGSPVGPTESQRKEN